MNRNLPLKSEAIKRFLEHMTHPDLAALYNVAQEVQVHASQDGGTRVDGDYQGRTWHAWEDAAGNRWKSFRIPLNAKTVPENNDGPMTWDLAQHAEGIGMTGWDWKALKSRWVGFDFDAISGHADAHAKKLTDKELLEIQEKACNIPWVTVRKSTSGKGLHLYVFTEPVETVNHDEHAALARAILGMMSAYVGFDFQGKVDAMGHIMWTWHRKMRGTDGLTLLKQGETLHEIPVNWRDHIDVIQGKRKKIRPGFLTTDVTPLVGSEDESTRIFEELCGQATTIPLDSEHDKLLTWLRENNAYGAWSADHHMLITHTYHLKEAHESLGLKGPFQTLSKGTEFGHDQNCFAYPLRRGAWVVRRYGPGVAEAPTWSQDSAGWTRCFGGETPVLTKQGVKSIKELAAIGWAELHVLTDSGMQWIKCPVKSYGHQTLMRIGFGDGSSVRATANHEWLYAEPNHFNLRSRRQTYELTGSTRLPLGYPELAEINADYWEGMAHGFVYGDGSKKRDFSRVTLYGCDNDLFRLLCRWGDPTYEKREDGYYKNAVMNLPIHWQELPENPSRSYALGFVMGMNSADGSMGKTAQIFQANPYTLQEIRRLAQWAGLRTMAMRLAREESPFDGSHKPLYVFNFSTWNLTQEMILRSDYKRQLVKSRKPRFMYPVSVTGHGNTEVEEVFCAYVPKWNNFTLANGVITGNCFYNRDPDLQTVARSQGANEHKSGGYVFQHAEQAQAAVLALGSNLDLPPWAGSRATKLRERKEDGKLVAEIPRDPNDNGGEMIPKGWYHEGKSWYKVINIQTATPIGTEVGNYDDMVRHIVTVTSEDYGWVLKRDNEWGVEPLAHVRTALESFGLTAKDCKMVLGGSVFKPWTLVNLPFQPEYPGDRKWNRGAAQLRYYQSSNTDNLSYPHWLKILNHIGSGLDVAVKQHPWARANGIMTGADYLKIWIASVFQAPQEPLPYLFLYSTEQNTGKSIFHEALSLLMTSGVVRADSALTNQSSFNGELENAVLCVVEETDLRRHKQAYNRIKDWVTSRQLPIHKKQQTPYTVPNTSHWIQCHPKETWILTTEGPRRIKELLNRPVTIIYDGEAIQTEGFKYTGHRELFEIETIEGFKVQATAEHPLLSDFDGLALDRRVDQIEVGDALYLSKHLNAFWEGEGTFEEGYILGWLTGDGNINPSSSQEHLLFCHPDHHLVSWVAELFPKYPTIQRYGDEIRISSPYLKELILKYGLDASKEINEHLESASSEFIKGFLSAFFDADGGAPHLEIRLGQSNLLRLEAIQRMLIHFGIVGEIRFCQQQDRNEKEYQLVIRKSNTLVFQKRVGFQHREKSALLEQQFSGRQQIHTSRFQENFLVRVKSVRSVGVHPVYNADVPVARHYSANGFASHNCSNDHNSCPVSFGDSRITMVHVPVLDPIELIPKREMLARLEKEASDFMAAIIALEIPPSGDRLNVPVIATDEKLAAEKSSQTLLEMYINENVHHVTGKSIKISDFFDRFQNWLDPSAIHDWTKIRVGREMPIKFPKGRQKKDGQFYYGNMDWSPRQPGESILPKFVVVQDHLVLETEVSKK